MTNPELADKILRAIYDGKGMIPSGGLAASIGADQSEVIKMVYEIKSYNDEFLRVAKGYGDSQLMIGQNQRMENKIALFLQAGGFIAISKANQAEKESQQERNMLELEHLKLEIANLQGLPLEQRRTRRLSRAAILISIAAILYEILKDVFLKA